MGDERGLAEKRVEKTKRWRRREKAKLKKGEG